MQRAALELFAEKGYDATTTAQIARRAGVSEMSLFRHFATKDALLLDDPFDPLIGEAVVARPADETPMRAVVESVRETWAELSDEVVPVLRQRLRIVAEAQSLDGALERNSAATATVIADSLVSRGVQRDAARVAAAAVIAGLSAALLEWARNGDRRLDQALDEALDVLGGASACSDSTT
ncbi:transcriptional regulator, TetR family [Georgenia satyanarayanai]|uniref:Transcriptional regulator, TetR family n=1 Tax=Georgenia satyanarayanai TaxID=860221 RepID=A0A2Y9A5J5_9MICO|nr:TetR family transcriptional regulator [Georgenia satyanarayanai]SSA39176.1 transcriptional regulator, TetR family [Georgenia satyanarayanai]